MDIDDSKLFTNVTLFYMRVMMTTTSPDENENFDFIHKTLINFRF